MAKALAFIKIDAPSKSRQDSQLPLHPICPGMAAGAGCGVLAAALGERVKMPIKRETQARTRLYPQIQSSCPNPCLKRTQSCTQQVRPRISTSKRNPPASIRRLMHLPSLWRIKIKHCKRPSPTITRRGTTLTQPIWCIWDHSQQHSKKAVAAVMDNHSSSRLASGG